jgi:serine phosphatase RsbU (regulator of sigma subunit)/anti-sigma regulatory factor (Ser/Thr protein kinase)
VTAPVQTRSGRVFRIDVVCDLDSVREATRRLRLFLAGEGLTELEQSSWELACVEAATNAVEHVRPEYATQPVCFHVSATDEEIEIDITDRTPGFRWPEDPQLPDEDSESGRGIYLITQLTDHADYLQGRSENRLVMRRKRDSRKTDATEEKLRQQIRELDDTLNTMTEELAACYESLTAIFRFTEDLKRGQHGNDLVAKWLAELLPVCGADWCVLRLVAPDQHTLFTAGCSVPELTLAPLDLDATGGAAASAEIRVILDGAELWFDPAHPLNDGDPLKRMNGETGICHPIFHNGQPFGVISAGRSENKSGLSAGQANILRTIADFLSIQLRNLRLQEDYVRSQLMSRELQIAERIQRSLLPEVLPQPEGYGLAGYSRSASQVGGDFYDAISLADGSVLLVMADVMGKGVPAAMFAAILRSTLRARPDLAAWPQELMMWLNQSLFDDLDRVDMFATIQFVYFDPQSGSGRIASAGHCPAIFAGPGVAVSEIDVGGPPIGVVRSSEYRDEIFTMEPGALFLVFTDGVTDARNSAGEAFGTERLKRFIEESTQRGWTSEQATRELAAEVARFQGNHPAFDDVTFLLLGRTPVPAAPVTLATDAIEDTHR